MCNIPTAAAAVRCVTSRPGGRLVVGFGGEAAEGRGAVRVTTAKRRERGRPLACIPGICVLRLLRV